MCTGWSDLNSFVRVRRATCPCTVRFVSTAAASGGVFEGSTPRVGSAAEAAAAVLVLVVVGRAGTDAARTLPWTLTQLAWLGPA
jgi:hypothetical protein